MTKSRLPHLSRRYRWQSKCSYQRPRIARHRLEARGGATKLELYSNVQMTACLRTQRNGLVRVLALTNKAYLSPSPRRRMRAHLTLLSTTILASFFNLRTITSTIGLWLSHIINTRSLSTLRWAVVSINFKAWQPTPINYYRNRCRKKKRMGGSVILTTRWTNQFSQTSRIKKLSSRDPAMWEEIRVSNTVFIIINRGTETKDRFL